MRDAGARAHALHVAGADHRARAHAVLVRERALEHVGDDLHVAVPVRAEALRRAATRSSLITRSARKPMWAGSW